MQKQHFALLHWVVCRTICWLGVVTFLESLLVATAPDGESQSSCSPLFPVFISG